MQTEQLVFLALAIFAGMLLMKYIYWSIGRKFTELARYENDPQARHARISELDGIIAREPQNAEALLERATLLGHDRDFTRATHDLEKYLELAPEDSAGWGELAECCLQTGHAVRAREAAEHAIALDGCYTDFRRLRLRALLLENELPQAGDELDIWRDLEHKRLEAGAGTKPLYAPYAGIPPGPARPDPALRLYEAALLWRRGERPAAGQIRQELRETAAEYLESTLESDPVLANMAEEWRNCP